MTKNEERINRLADALTYYRERRPSDPRWLQRHLQTTARRFNIAIPLMRRAVTMMREVEHDDESNQTT
jgi:hypothetical protein